MVAAIFILRYPAAQTYLSKKVAGYLSQQLQADISLDKVYFKPFTSLELRNLSIHDRQGDTLLFAQRAQAAISLAGIWDNRVSIQQLELDDTYIQYEIYQDSTNVDFLVDYFNPPKADPPTTNKDIRLDLQQVSLTNSRFKLIDHRYQHHHRGVDFSDLYLTDISGDFSAIQYTDSTVQATVQQLTFREKSGLYLQEFSAKCFISSKQMEFTDLLLRTNRSKVGDYLAFHYDDFTDFTDFIDKVDIQSTLRQSFVDSRDIEFFAPEMRYVRFTTDVMQASVSGTVEHIQAQDVHLQTGKHTSLRGDFTVDGLPDIEHTQFDFSLEHFQTSAGDVETLVPDLSNRPAFTLPEQLHLLKTINYRGVLNGYYHNFHLDGTAQTALGPLYTQSDITVKPELTYRGTVRSDTLNLGKLLASQELRTTGLDLAFEGAGSDIENLHISSNGQLFNFFFKDHHYRNMTFDGALADERVLIRGMVSDPDAELQFDGEMSWQDADPVYSFNATVDRLDLKRLNLFQKDSIVVNQSNIQAKLYGDSLSTLNGHITSDHIQFSSTRGNFIMNYLDFTSEGDAQSKQLTLKSDVLDGVMSGQIDLATIGRYFRSLAMRYAPAINIETKPYRPQNFDLQLKIKSFAPISALFDPNLALDDGAQLTANFSSDDYTASFQAHSPVLSYKGMRISNLKMIENADDQAFSLDVTADRFSFSDSTYIDNIVINNILANDSLTFGIALSETDRPNHLVLGGNIHFAHDQPAYIRLNQSEIVLNNESWTINEQADMRVSKGKLYLDDLHISRDQQDVRLNGILSDADDHLGITFSNFNLSSLSGITRPLGIELLGHLNGEVQMYSLFGKPTLSAHVSTTPIIYNNLPIGTLSVDADFNPQTGIMQLGSRLLDVDGGGFTLDGTYEANADKDALNLKGSAHDLDLGIAQPFLRSLVSDLYGSMSGEISVNGTLRKPIINGRAHIQEASFLVDYLQTAYHINDQHSLIHDNRILLHDLKLYDVHRTVASASGSVNLQTLSDPTLAIDIRADNFQILNTARRDNELFFGTAYASGSFGFHGPTSAMAIAIDARTNPNTIITIPFNTSLTVSDNDFLYFMDADNQTATGEDSGSKKLFRGLTMNMDIAITPDATVNLENNTGSLTGVGSGDISLRISSLGDFEMFGDYLVSSGKFHFTAQDFFNKFFDLKEGGTIRWAGNPSEATINLGATYQQRTSIAPLYNAAGRTENNDRVLAQADMILQGTLSQPEVSFDLNFPQTPYVKDELQGYLSDVNNVNQQAISLIIRRSFTPASTQEFGQEVNNTLLSAGTEIAFNQLNSIISQSLNMNFLDLNIRSFNDASASLRFFDDRLVLTGGVSDRSQNQLNDLTVFSDQIATDAEVTFRLRRDGNLVLRAYNRLNTRNFLFTPYSDYISAVGLVYRQEFNSISEFWRKLWIWNERKKALDDNKQ